MRNFILAFMVLTIALAGHVVTRNLKVIAQRLDVIAKNTRPIVSCAPDMQLPVDPQ